MCPLKEQNCIIMIYCYMAQMFTPIQMKIIVDSTGALHTVSEPIKREY